jgi:hypothetical protein
LIDLYGKDMILGSKMAPWSIDQRSFSRKFISWSFNKFLKLYFGFKGSDTHGIKLLRKSVRDNILKECKTNTGIFDTEFVIRTQKCGYQIADFPVKVREIRPPRFNKRLLQTPLDIIQLINAFKK